VLPLAGSEAKAIADIMRRYEDIRSQLADAALVYLADREGVDTIFTLDRRDFRVIDLPVDARSGFCQTFADRARNLTGCAYKSSGRTRSN
jgi:hypothetical protein